MTEQVNHILAAGFKVPSSAYADERRRETVRVWLLPVILFVLATAVAGFFDMRLWILGFMFMLLGHTVILFYAWLKLIDRHGIQWALRPQVWKIDTVAKRIDIDFMPLETGNEDDDEPVEPERSLSLFRKDIHSFSHGSTYHCIRLNENPLDIRFLLIPAEAFAAIRIFSILE